MKPGIPQLVALALAAGALPLAAENDIPRMPDGKPDLSGFWQGPLMRNFFESVGGPPFTPEGQKAYESNLK